MEDCRKKDGGYAEFICEFMAEAASYNPTKRQKGLFMHSMVNIQTNERLGTAISVKTESKPNGVFLNYCPFCGGELRDQSRDGE